MVIEQRADLPTQVCPSLVDRGSARAGDGSGLHGKPPTPPRAGRALGGCGHRLNLPSHGHGQHCFRSGHKQFALVVAVPVAPTQARGVRFRGLKALCRRERLHLKRNRRVCRDVLIGQQAKVIEIREALHRLFGEEAFAADQQRHRSFEAAAGSAGINRHDRSSQRPAVALLYSVRLASSLLAFGIGRWQSSTSQESYRSPRVA